MPCLGSRVELFLEAWVQISQPKCTRAEELTLPLVDGGIGWPSIAVLENSPGGVGKGDLVS